MRKKSSKGELLRAAAILDVQNRYSNSRKNKKKPMSVSRKELLLKIDAIDEKIDKSDADWDNLTPSDLVAIYAWGHNNMYKTFPADIVGQKYGVASMAAGRLIRDEFRDDIMAAVDYMRWIFERETRRIKYRSDNKIPSISFKRITWRGLFVEKGMLMDYKVAWALK